MTSPVEAATPAGAHPTSIAGLLGEVNKDLSELVRQEIALAQAEATESVTRMGKGAGLLGGAGVAGHFVLLFVSIALWWVIGNSTGRGWAAVILAAVWAVICAALAVPGRQQIRSARGLARTTDSVKKIPTALKGHEQENS